MGRTMRDSGIEWIGEIPEGWEVYKIKNIVNFNPRYDKTFDDGTNISFLPMERIGQGNMSPMDAKIEKVKNGYTYFADGDIVLAKVTPCFENGNIAIAKELLNGVGFGSSELYVFRCIKINRVFLFYFLQNPNFKEHCISSMYGTGGLKRVSAEFIREFKLALPPLPKQQAIADFLDAKCGMLDDSIAKQKAVIEKLKAYKQSVITEAVTQGLDPAAKMKPSGIEWIGEIPEGWDLCKIKYLTSKIGSGKTPKGGSEVYTDNGIIFLRSQNIYNYGLNIDDVVFISNKIDEEMANTRVFKNDILLNITGGSIGRACIYNETQPANVSQHVCIIRPINKVDVKYLHAVIVGDIGFHAINIFQSGANREGLNFEQIANLVIPLPPLPEQIAIAEHLDAKCAKIDNIITGKQKLIEKLSEYKKSLIYECVTGKREVANGRI